MIKKRVFIIAAVAFVSIFLGVVIATKGPFLPHDSADHALSEGCDHDEHGHEEHAEQDDHGAHDEHGHEENEENEENKGLDDNDEHD